MRRHPVPERTQLREIPQQRSSVPAPEAELAAVVLEHAAEPVPLRLVPPGRALGDLLDEQRLLWRERNVRARGRDDVLRGEPSGRWRSTPHLFFAFHAFAL